MEGQGPSGEQARIRCTPDLLTVETGAFESFSFDAAGCLVRAAWAGNMVRWALDGGCLVKQLRAFGAPRCRRYLDAERGLKEAKVAYLRAGRLLAELAYPIPAPWEAVVQDIRGRGPELMQERANLAARIYSPIGILPPDQYGALILQLTEGCRYNQCSFCSFYRGRQYREKTPEEFAAHIGAVLAMVGPALSRRRAVFLGDANALGLRFPQLEAAFGIMHELLPVGPKGIEGVYTFMDVFGHGPTEVEEFAALASWGLRRVYVGAESGSPFVLRTLRKPASPERLAEMVQAMKQGGVAVGLVFLLGVGGERLAAVHARETAELLSRLPLDEGDIIYFSELLAEPGSDYATWASREGIHPLDRKAMRVQERLMRQGLAPVAEGGPRVTRYDVREFVYY